MQQALVPNQLSEVLLDLDLDVRSTSVDGHTDTKSAGKGSGTTLQTGGFSSSDHCLPLSTPNQWLATSDGSSCIRTPNSDAQLRLPFLYEPERAPAFQELFLNHFIRAFFDARTERSQASDWSVALQTFLQNHEQSSSIVYAIRAATMAHYGKISGDVTIQLDSMRWYSRGLQSQRVDSINTQNKLALGGKPDEIFNETVISTPMMLMFFETVMGTTPLAWGQHLHVASLMLQVVGPWKCREGILHHIFKVVRIGAVRGFSCKKPCLYGD